MSDSNTTLPNPQKQLANEARDIIIGLVAIGIILSIGCLLISLFT